MILSKKLGKQTIEIRYQASEPTPEDEEEKQGEEKQGEENKASENAEKDGLSRSVELSIVVENPDGSGLQFECITEGKAVDIIRVHFNKKIQEFAKMGTIERMTKMYQGPHFLSLDEKVQNSFRNYLEHIGVTGNLIDYIDCSAMDKEERLYQNWLEEMKKFVSAI